MTRTILTALAPAAALSKLQRLTIAGALAMPVAFAATSSDAMVLTNCLDNGVDIRITGQSSQRVMDINLSPDATKEVATGRSESFRLNINVPGKDVQYSNRKGTEHIFLTTIAGNYELTNDGCRRPAAQPAPAPGPGGDGLEDVAAKLLLHIAHCQSRYLSYRVSDNTFQSNGRRKPCVSPYI